MMMMATTSIVLHISTGNYMLHSTTSSSLIVLAPGAAGVRHASSQEYLGDLGGGRRHQAVAPLSHAHATVPVARRVNILRNFQGTWQRIRNDLISVTKLERFILRCANAMVAEIFGK